MSIAWNSRVTMSLEKCTVLLKSSKAMNPKKTAVVCSCMKTMSVTVRWSWWARADSHLPFTYSSKSEWSREKVPSVSVLILLLFLCK